MTHGIWWFMAITGDESIKLNVIDNYDIIMLLMLF